MQPALKVRGREYLRIVYGPEYTLPDQLERLRERGLNTKRRLALHEFSLGIEALHRFVERAAAARASTNACSACWRSRANRSTRGCEAA